MIITGAGRLLRIFIGALLVVMLSSCGLKGDLYLPEPENAAAGLTRDKANTDPSEGLTTETPATDKAVDDDKETTSVKQPEGAAPQP